VQQVLRAENQLGPILSRVRRSARRPTEVAAVDRHLKDEFNRLVCQVHAAAALMPVGSRRRVSGLRSRMDA
jgi:hypothetical protein